MLGSSRACTYVEGAVWASGERSFRLGGSRTITSSPVDALGPTLSGGSLHAVYVDDVGGVWSVGGDVLTATLDQGMAIHHGAPVPPLVLSVDGDETSTSATCPSSTLIAGANRSIARRWDEQALASIRRDLPRPTVHARNLFHLSAAMWDAWSAYDPVAKRRVCAGEAAQSEDVQAAREEAISFAAYRVLADHYAKAVGGPVDLACYRAVMRSLGYDPDDRGDVGDTPRALGNRIGRTVVANGARDGSNQAGDYANDPTPYATTNSPLVIDDVGAELANPSVWQPLNLSVAATQNGIVLPAGVQEYIGSQWGAVATFAMTRPRDVGPRPTPETALSGLVEVLDRSSELDVSDGVMMDSSPGAYGNNALGANDGSGRPINPVTHEPYAPEIVRRADFGRALAEFWADGPQSETPPGHWNVIANGVADKIEPRRLEGRGAPLDALAWDVHVYLALNGALHDAAVAAWGEKRRSTTVRPISLIRWMGVHGTLPTVPGLIEPITEESSAPGQRHEHLAAFKGQMAVRAWRGEPCDRATQAAGVGWIRAAAWMPYQRRTFVTPAFPAFVSGHSTFSRAAAEVLATLTGSPFFPGGLGEYVLPKDTWLTFELGPTTDVHLQWATYDDAADQAGQSRVWGGIHISADDFAGRKLGAAVGKDAVALAKKYFDGTVR